MTCNRTAATQRAWISGNAARSPDYFRNRAISGIVNIDLDALRPHL